MVIVNNSGRESNELEERPCHLELRGTDAL